MSQPSPEPARPIDVAHALRSPTSVFRRPYEVLSTPGLRAEERRAILVQWELDARRLEESEAEGLDGGEPSLLRQVHLALAELEERS